MKYTNEQIAAGWAQFVQEYMDRGWTPYFFTFQFDPIGGSTHTIHRKMLDEIERVYRTFVTRVVRRPKSIYQVNKMPVFMCAPDFPVFKLEKQTKTIFINDGRHFHAIVLIPPVCRCGDIEEHFLLHERLYIGRDWKLSKLHIEPITHDIPRVVNYTYKTILHNLADSDDILLLPRSLCEVRDVA